MATDVSESSGADCKGDTRNSAKLDADYPLRVLYCGVCSLPTEYCEYMPDVAKCRQWLEKNFPNEFAKLTVGTDFGSEEEEGIIEENENEAEGKNQGEVVLDVPFTKVFQLQGCKAEMSARLLHREFRCTFTG